MSDFDKEKQTFYDWYNERGRELMEWGNSTEIVAEDAWQYAQENAREELTRLLAEIDKRDKKIASWDYVFGEDGPTEITKKLDSLRAEIENVRRNAEHWYNERNKEIKKYQAEIERKDEAIDDAIWYLRNGELEARNRGMCFTSVIEELEQALQNKEGEDEKG